MSELSLDALSLSSWQACRRQFLLHHDFRVLKRRPKALFDQCLRKGIVSLAAATPPEQVISDTVSSFLEAAAAPGLDLPYGADPYRVAKDYCAMLDTILRAMARTSMYALHDPAQVAMNSYATWRLLSYADDTGTLHRWVTVDSWGEDDLARELHSWRTMGDMAFARVPMVLHVIEIGQQRGGRRQSPWARAWRHPAMPALRLRFQRTDGSDLAGWKPFYLADHPEADRDEWVTQMYTEGVVQKLIRTVNVDCPSDAVCDQTRAQIMYEAVRIREAIEDRGMVPWSSYPMSRGVCDGWVPCPFQPACYSERAIDPQTLGLYQIRVREKVRAGGNGTR